MIFTREIINKNIKYYDVNVNDGIGIPYTYHDLISRVDAYKNLLIKNGAQHGQSILIGTQASLSQIAMIIACSELGLIISIVESPKNENNELAISYERLLPIDFFVIENQVTAKNFEVYRDTIRKTLLLSEQTLDYTPNNNVYVTENSIFLKCFDGRKKEVIEHKQDFITKLSLRNSKLFYGKIGMLRNLNHGSSVATYFLPNLLSDRVTEFYNIFCKSEKFYNRILGEQKLSLDHLLYPYTKMMDDFFESETTMENCILYTLSIVRKEWVNKLQGKVKDVISMFGTSLTSGPYLINQATDQDFSENSYKTIDDYYKIRINDKNSLEIMMPDSNEFIDTNDIFVVSNNKYFYQGNYNYYRVNDTMIDIRVWNKIVSNEIDAYTVVDTFKNRIYLAIWDKSVDQNKINKIDKRLKNRSDQKHYIHTHAYLNRDDYYDGDRILLGELINYFRNLESVQ